MVDDVYLKEFPKASFLLNQGYKSIRVEIPSLSFIRITEKMKLQIFIAVILFSLSAVIAQEDGEVEEVFQCFSGDLVDGVGNQTLEDCAPNEDTCQTKIEIRDGVTHVWKECKTQEACENNAKNNPSECHSDAAIEKGLRVCFSCCSESGCNSGEDIPDPAPPTEAAP